MIFLRQYLGPARILPEIGWMGWFWMGSGSFSVISAENLPDVVLDEFRIVFWSRQIGSDAARSGWNLNGFGRFSSETAERALESTKRGNLC